MTGERVLEGLVRVGFLARAATYGVIGVLAMALALGAGTGGNAPSQQGALALVARAPLGVVALIGIVAGLLAYSVWKFWQAARGHGPEGGGDAGLGARLISLGGGISYVVFAAVAIRILTGGRGGGSPKGTAAGILGWPGGPWIVGVAGLALIVISGVQIWDAVQGGFAQDSKTSEMREEERRMFLVAGRIGLVARALVFVLVGYFLIRTAIDFNPSAAVGVDGALRRLHGQPLGPLAVGLVALGLLVFAGFSLIEARYRRL
jgi:hypothetical protein